MKKIALVAVAAVAALSLTACSEFNERNGRGDAPVDRELVDDTAPHVINFPDTFGNVAHKCDGFGHRVYTNTHGTEQSTTTSFIAVVPDPTCSAAPVKGGTK